MTGGKLNFTTFVSGGGHRTLPRLTRTLETGLLCERHLAGSSFVAQGGAD